MLHFLTDARGEALKELRGIGDNRQRLEINQHRRIGFLGQFARKPVDQAGFAHAALTRKHHDLVSRDAFQLLAQRFKVFFTAIEHILITNGRPAGIWIGYWTVWTLVSLYEHNIRKGLLSGPSLSIIVGELEVQTRSGHMRAYCEIEHSRVARRYFCQCAKIAAHNVKIAALFKSDAHVISGTAPLVADAYRDHNLFLRANLFVAYLQHEARFPTQAAQFFLNHGRPLLKQQREDDVFWQAMRGGALLRLSHLELRQFIANPVECIRGIDQTGHTISHCFTPSINPHNTHHPLSPIKDAHDLADAGPTDIVQHIGACNTLVARNSIDGFSPQDVAELFIDLEQFLTIEGAKLVGLFNGRDGLIKDSSDILRIQVGKLFDKYLEGTPDGGNPGGVSDLLKHSHVGSRIEERQHITHQQLWMSIEVVR